jgi:hypothetical protein
MHPWPMTRPRHPRLVALTLLVLIVGACGEAEVSDPPTPIPDLSAPWQAQPFPVDPAIVAAAEQMCRDPAGMLVPVGTPLGLVDARGGNRLLLVFAGPGKSAECVVGRDRAGRLLSEGGGSSIGDIEPALGPNEMVLHGASTQSGTGGPNEPVLPMSYVTGSVGPGIQAVEIALPSGVSMRASLNRGLFAAWWPGEGNSVVARGYDAAGQLVVSAE